MNYLAHAFLSGESDSIKVGNFLGDWVKGSALSAYADEIQRGIILHRHIDSFTDSHELVKRSAERFKARYFRYSGVIVDILYDHFLAANWSDFCDEPLNCYIEKLNTLMFNHLPILPVKLQSYIPRYFGEQWMHRYATLDGICDVLVAMSQGTSLPSAEDFAMSVIENHYELFKIEFYDFFSQIIDYIEQEFMISIRVAGM